jgi:hypothetical protein
MILEAADSFPAVVDDVLIVTAFLAARPPFLLPAGEEDEAARAHAAFRDPLGDLTTYVRLFRAWRPSGDQEAFCASHFLDPRGMEELANIHDQMSEILEERGVEVRGGGDRKDIVRACLAGLGQFVCRRTGPFYSGRGFSKVLIHPGSVLFNERPPLIAAGEIVRTKRTYARSVSVVRPEWVGRRCEPASDRAPALGKRRRNLPRRPGRFRGGGRGRGRT